MILAQKKKNCVGGASTQVPASTFVSSIALTKFPQKFDHTAMTSAVH